MMKISSNLSDINAEMLLDYLYPEYSKKWIARNRGVFYRNYSPDVLDINVDNHLVELSRDNFLKLLPQGLFVSEDELKGNNTKERVEEIEKRVQLLEDTFLPFDTFWFRRKLAVEREVSELLNFKLEFILKEFFNFDLSRETNLYVRDAAILLPYVNRFKGDMNFVRQLLSSVLNCQVILLKKFQAADDYVSCQFPLFVFHLLIPDLSAKAFRQKEDELQPFFEFVKEWFIPFDIHCEVKIKTDTCFSRINGNFVLNYNTVL